MRRIDKIDVFLGVIAIAIGCALEPDIYAAGFAGICVGGGLMIGCAIGRAGRG